MVADAIAVGDYFLDHHHSKHHLPPEERLAEDFPSNGPFQIPLRVALTDRDDRFLAADKNIAVSHIVNGCTRLQPAVMLTGQALGAAAAMAVQQGTTPDRLDVRALQDRLIDAGCQLYVAYDVPTGHRAFGAVQRLALAGVLRDDDPVRLEPDAAIDADAARHWAARAEIPDAVRSGAEGPLRRRALGGVVRERLPDHGDPDRGDYLVALDAVLRERSRP